MDTKFIHFFPYMQTDTKTHRLTQTNRDTHIHIETYIHIDKHEDVYTHRYLYYGYVFKQFVGAGWGYQLI